MHWRRYGLQFDGDRGHTNIGVVHAWEDHATDAERELYLRHGVHQLFVETRSLDRAGSNRPPAPVQREASGPNLAFAGAIRPKRRNGVDVRKHWPRHAGRYDWNDALTGQSFHE